MSTFDPLRIHFDAVVFLTWSDWRTEPRSNRYHYASRFSQHLPVLFLQPNAGLMDRLEFSRSELPNLEIVDTPDVLSRELALELQELLYARGFKAPLIWMYNARSYNELFEAFRAKGTGYFVYHATEDYFSQSVATGFDTTVVSEWVADMVRRSHLVVAVSQGVADAYRDNVDSSADYIVVENGCDAEFAQSILEDTQEPAPQRVAIYQGGINNRLDFSLLLQLAREMPDWQFVFCGRSAHAPEAWASLKSRPNVRYLGELGPEELGRQMAAATVGLIPFLIDDWIQTSLPLKAFEYVSFGLPVVSVPIPALKPFPDAFQLASTAAEFRAAITRIAPTRSDSKWIAARLELAAKHSYNERFATVVRELTSRRAAMRRTESLNAVVLYDDRHIDVSTIREHLESFQKYSRHSYVYLPATGSWSLDSAQFERSLDLNPYDLLIVHYSLRISLPDYFFEGVARAVERFRGLKVLFVQDEYEKTEIARRWMERLRFDLVFSCVPMASIEQVYPAYRFPGTTYLPTLTGYVPETDGLDRFVLPIQQRPLDIVYRGRMLPFHYGELGYEKYRIGVDVKRLANSRGLRVDIEVDDGKRIYGDAWYKFLASGRATLGTESGASIFDFNGEVAEEVERETRRDPTISFETIEQRVLSKYSIPVRMNQISPKIFEAIRLRTVLVLFEGTYSGVVEADRHFLPLKKDYSNIDEVFERLADDREMTDMAQRAFDDVIDSGDYSYRRFAEDFDASIQKIRTTRPLRQVLLTPLFSRTHERREYEPLLRNEVVASVLTSAPIGEDFQREQALQAITSAAPAFAVSDPAVAEALVEQESDRQSTAETGLIADSERAEARPSMLAKAWRLLPASWRKRLGVQAQRYLIRREQGYNTHEADFKVARWIWRLLPVRLRAAIADRVRRRPG